MANIANQMLPYLNAGTDAINQFKSEFETIGALSNEQVAALAKLDDTIYLLKESLKNVCLQIGASFAPLLQRVAEIINTSLIPKLQKLAEWFNSLTIEQQAFAAKVLLVVAALAPLALGIGKVVSAIGGIIKLIPALQAGLSALAANPIILIIVAAVFRTAAALTRRRTSKRLYATKKCATLQNSTYQSFSTVSARLYCSICLNGKSKTTSFYVLSDKSSKTAAIIYLSDIIRRNGFQISTWRV